MPSTTDSLMATAVCIEQCVPKGMHLPILITLFAQIAGVSTMNTDQLMSGAVCIEQCIPKGMQLPVLISLAQQILAGGGTGGGTGLSGVGSPQGVVTANPGTTYLDTVGGGLWAKQSGTGNTGWLELIAP